MCIFKLAKISACLKGCLGRLLSNYWEWNIEVLLFQLKGRIQAFLTILESSSLALLHIDERNSSQERPDLLSLVSDGLPTWHISPPAQLERHHILELKKITE